MSSLPGPRTFACPAATGAAYDHGAHVVAWTPTGHEPVLWLSGSTRLDDTAPVRGGVPVCWPWFGPGRTKDLAPAHGFARIAPWTWQGATETDEAVTATWTLTSDQATHEAFPHPYAAVFRATFGQVLELSLTVENTGADELSYEAALHTYLAVGDIRQVRVAGLDGATYLDKAPGGGPDPVTQHGDVTFTAETDRVYDATGPVRVVDPVGGRTLTVETDGAANLVVWNPWVAKSAAMPDFGDDEWPGMLCVEGANVLDHAVVLAPGATHALTYRLQVARD